VRSSAPLSAVPSLPAAEPLDRRRPNVSGDLRALFQHAPVFRRRPAGYDRFQVDTYVRWAEEELAVAARERDEVLLRHARLRADLDEARRLLCHTPSGRESLQLSVRLGSVLAAAADQADGIRADAEATRAAAEAEAGRLVAEASAEAERLVAEASAEAERLTADAVSMVAEAEQVMKEARAEADARLDKVREMEQLAQDQVDRLRRQATRDAETARLQAREEVLRMLSGAREDRRRWEERHAALRAQLVALEERVADAGGMSLVAVPVPREAPPVDVVARGGRRAVPLAHLGRRFRRG
jgi:colicin import membrane protein